MAEPHKQHHWVPILLLEQFATKRSRERLRRVEILDLRTGAWRRQRPAKVCHKSRLYDIYVPGADPKAIETEILGRLEVESGPLIQGLGWLATRDPAVIQHLPATEREILAAFVAQLYARSWAVRQRGYELADALGQEYLKRLTRSREHFEERVSRARADGVEIDDSFTFDVAREMADDGSVGMDLTQNFHLMVMLRTWREFYDRLVVRPPTFLVAGKSRGLFVASDDPIGLTRPLSDDEGLSLFEPYQVDPRSEEATISLPLSPELAVVFEVDTQQLEVSQASKLEVARLNTMTALVRGDIVVSATRDFSWWDGEQIQSAAALKGFADVVREKHRLACERSARDRASKLIASLYPDDES